MFDYDKTSKWLISRHGDSVLRLGGVTGPFQWKPLQPEVVQPRQLPDGMLEVRFPDSPEPDIVAIEIATFPDRRVGNQVVRDMMFAYLDRGRLPEMLVLVLRPKGRLSVAAGTDLTSRVGLSACQVRWRVVELWRLSAEELLSTGDVGLIPWVPLTEFSGPPEPLIRRCREVIDVEAPADERDNFLAVTQVMTKLRFGLLRPLMSILGGSKVMIESTLITEIVSKRVQTSICDFLEARFGPVPQDVLEILNARHDDGELRDLSRYAGRCPDIDAFRRKLESLPPPKPLDEEESDSEQ